MNKPGQRVILAVGSIALDSVETPAGRRSDVLGGSATYFGYAASFFSPVRLVAAVGGDFPKRYLSLLESRGIDLTSLEHRRGKTFRWHGRYCEDPNVRVTLSVCPNVFSDFHPRLAEEARQCPFVFLANIAPELQHEILKQMRKPRFVAMDTMNLWISSSRKPLTRSLADVDLLLVNDSEARELSGERNLVRAARWLRSRGPSCVVIKKGEHGALLFASRRTFWAPAYPLETIVDPTGAGDAFAGGLVGYLAKAGACDYPHLKRGLLYGSVLGSFAVESFSLDRLRRLKRGDVDKRYRELRQLVML